MTQVVWSKSPWHSFFLAQDFFTCKVLTNLAVAKGVFCKLILAFFARRSRGVAALLFAADEGDEDGDFSEIDLELRLRPFLVCKSVS